MKNFTALLLILSIYCTAFGQSLSTINGVVINTRSEPIGGVAISILNTNYSAITNKDGKFTITGVSAGDCTLHISKVAYAERDLTLTVKNGPQNISIQLKEATTQLDEIVVTAEKREEEVQHVPVSISTLSASQVREYRLQNLNDITGVVPNLYNAGPGDNRNVTGLRGIATTSYDPAVVTYIDGVEQFTLDTYIPQLFDVARIEVLRGPQGTLYGRNALGGVINIITKQPSNEVGGFAGFAFGSYGQQRYSLGIRTPLVKDRLFLGVAGVYSGTDGYYINLYNHTHFDNQHYFLGNYYLKYLAGEKYTLTLNVKNFENRNHGPFQLAASKAKALSSPFTVNQNAITEMIDNTLDASLSANYAGSNFNLTSVSSYEQNYRYYTSPIDGDFSPIDAVTLVNNYGSSWNKIRVATQEFRFSTPASSLSAFKWTAGFNGFLRDAPKKVGTHFGRDAAAVGSPISNFTSINTNIERNYGAAAFGQVIYTINPQWDVTVGLRYDVEHKKETVKGEFQPDGRNAIVTRADTSSAANFRSISPKLTVANHLSDNNNLFASYSRGFRAGGISQLGSNPAQPPLFSYKPEYSDNYEIGSKNYFFDRRIRINLSAFYTLVTDAQVPTLILPDAITITKNAGKLNSKGIEAELAATLNGLTVDYNFGYTNAHYTDLVVGNKKSLVSLKGNRQVYTPEITSVLAVQYAYNIDKSNNIQLISRGEWHYLGDEYFDLANHIEQPGFSLFDAAVGLHTKKLDLLFWGNNLADNKHIDYAYDFGAAHLGNPRTYGVSLNLAF